MKPLFIMTCTDAKTSDFELAKGMYKGAMINQLRHTLGDEVDSVQLAFLSAKYGLIEGERLIETYNAIIPKAKTVAFDFYVKQFKSEAIRVMKELSHEDRDVYVFLSERYLAVFEYWMEHSPQFKKAVRSNRSLYVSRKSGGIGTHKRRLSLCAKAELASTNQDVTVFRSGLSNRNELAYVTSGCDVGTSLFYNSPDHKTSLLPELLESTHKNQLMIDNGIVSLLKKGRSIDIQSVFSQYATIIKRVTRAQAGNISIVIPDSPDNPDEAVRLVHEHKDAILWLAQRCKVLLPIHRHADIKAHALRLMSELDFSENITVAVPCLEGELDLVLPLDQVESLFSLKNPHTNANMFKRCHFLGLSDASHKHKRTSRLQLAKIYGLECAMDACRTGSLFSNDNVGTQIANVLPAIYERTQVMQSDRYAKHDHDAEYRHHTREPLLTYDLHAMLNEEDIFEFWTLFNLCMHHANKPMLTMDINVDNTSAEEALEKAFDLIGTHEIENTLFESIKVMNWQWFKAHVELKPLSYDLKRFETIRLIFDQNSPREPFHPSVDFSPVMAA